jgi:hypothetical protein
MSNFVFSRRAIQHTLDQLGSVLTNDELEPIVQRLNRVGSQRLHAMWEVVMLNALARVGTLHYERSLPGGRRPDFQLDVAENDGSHLSIVGDILSVSDAGLDEQNPIDTLSDELARLAVKAGLKAAHFAYRVGGGRVGRYNDARIQLSLTNRGDLLKLMNSEVWPWIEGVATRKDEKSHFEYAKDGVAFSLAYDPARKYGGGGYLAYNVAASLDKNPLFGALKSKAKQLRGASESAVRAIIVTDGDCGILQTPVIMRSHGTFSAREVAKDFLRQNSSVDFVLLVSVTEHRHPIVPGSSYQMTYDVVTAPVGSISKRVTDEIKSTIDKTLLDVVKHIPAPVQSPRNAALRCRETKFGSDKIGAYKMTRNKIKVSSRAVLRLLAGEISPEEFSSAHEWNGERGNPFRQMLHSGRLIESASVQDGGDEDDDWLEFSFGAPNPAAAPFRVR